MNSDDILREEIRSMDDDELMDKIDLGLKHARKEARYLVDGPRHPGAENRVQTIREGLEQVDFFLQEVEQRASANREESEA